MTAITECNGYKVVQLKFQPESDTIHFVYMKEHSVREKCQEKPDGRTLFIVGTPPFVTEDAYRNAFSQFGKIESVFFQPSPSSTSPLINTSKFFDDHPEIKGFKVAYVVFEKLSAVRKALLSPHDIPLILSGPENPVVCGMRKWIKEYNDKIVNEKELQADIDVYMADYDLEAQAKKIKEKEELEPDKEGWTKVTRKGRKPGFARKESVHNKIMKKENDKRSKKQLLNFYRFQIRESKMNHLMALREKFEEDKKKIETMKKSRKFKPF